MNDERNAEEQEAFLVLASGFSLPFIIHHSSFDLSSSDPLFNAMNETTRLLRDLVRLPSVNPMGRELVGATMLEHRVTAYLEEFCRSLGVPCERQAVAPGRENLVARYEPTGAKRRLVFEVHQDTVPTDHMTIDPFGGVIEGGKLYGRGACDVKGGMASMLGAFARLVREKPANSAAVVLACTVDEEHTFLGVQRLAKGLKADGAVVAEPTGLQLVQAHKGVVRWHLRTAGRACHSSTPEQGVNAIYHMAGLLQRTEEFAATLQATRSDPLLGPATLSVGRIEGGTSVNTVPDRCQAEVDRRLIPGEDALVALEEFRAWLGERAPAPFEWSCSEPFLICPSLPPQASSAIARDLGRAIDDVVGSHRELAVPYGTDASTLAGAGIPSVVFGPGDIARAHTRDEWVPLDEVEQASEILYRLACMG
jgi:acetylornithine deacetylase